MLDDAFKLTLDVMFPPKSAAQIAEANEGDEAEAPVASGKPATFPVDGYADSDNIFGDQPFYILRVPGAVVTQGS